MRIRTPKGAGNGRWPTRKLRNRTGTVRTQPTWRGCGVTRMPERIRLAEQPGQLVEGMGGRGEGVAPLHISPRAPLCAGAPR